MSMNANAIKKLPPLWLLLAGLAAAIVTAPLAIRWELPIPECAMRALLGLPCLFCGGTRCLAELSGLNWMPALRLNPLVFGCAVLTMGWALVSLADRTLNTAWEQRIGRGLAHRPFGWILILVGLANWLYLCFNLPKD